MLTEETYTIAGGLILLVGWGLAVILCLFRLLIALATYIRGDYFDEFDGSVLIDGGRIINWKNSNPIGALIDCFFHFIGITVFGLGWPVVIPFIVFVSTVRHLRKRNIEKREIIERLKGSS